MTTVTDLIEEWIEMRSKLLRQLKMLESGEMQTGKTRLDSTTDATIARLHKCVGELNTLLKEHARVDGT